MAAMTRWKSRPAINGIRVYDADGAPLDPDNSTVVRERISLEKADPNILRNGDHHDRRCAHAPVDGHADLSAPPCRMERVRLCGDQ